ncbi:MAG: 50S ribosomal protein L17 [Deltaproteobacteria bacterium]|nr:50S ribosomal protein L17 [Deltaproteobacteria bacterium]
MRHHKKGRKLGRNSSHRRAMYRNMVASLFVHEKIETTHAKAMELRSIVEKIITRAAKAGDSVGKPLDSLNNDERAKQVHLRRIVGKFLPRFYDDGQGEYIDIMHKLFFVYGPRFKERPGGYTRVTKLGPRRGDNAPISRIELLS